ncbi:MAG: diphthine--ammonia ligase [Sulfolobales archaeon]|jgi:uncharacterized protein (TIGR00290 family)
MILAISWSGGKDSYLAYHFAREQGHDVRYAVHMFIEDKSFYHGPEELIYAQATQCLGMKLFIARTTWGSYEKDLKNILRQLRSLGVEGIVYGDLYIEDHRKWGTRVAEEVGLVPIYPVFGLHRDYLINKFISLGVKSMIIRTLDVEPYRNYLGKIIDHELFSELVMRGADPLGEGGEYHTLVLDAPYMKCFIEVLEGYVDVAKSVFSGKEYVYRIYVPRKYRIINKSSL